MSSSSSCRTSRASNRTASGTGSQRPNGSTRSARSIFGTLYNPSKYLDFNFLALVQAVEAYHRRASDETDQPPVEHEARIKAILDAAPPAHRDWLDQKLTYSNELSLRRRLKLLFTQFSSLLEDLVPDRKATISAIYDNRNYLTHYDPALKGRAATGARLLLMVEVLKFLLQASFCANSDCRKPRSQEFVSAPEPSG